MPCVYKVNRRHEFVLLRPSGRFTETDFIETCRAYYDHPDREPTFAHLWDGRSIDELVMNVDVIALYRDFLEENEERATVGDVVVIATRSMTETFATMLIQVSDLQAATYRLCRSLEEAADALGVPLAALRDESGFHHVEP
jgi:hypothetical protein